MLKVGSNKGEETLKKVAVIGGTGFLGIEVCKAALEEGFRVVSISRTGQPTNQNDDFTQAMPIDFLALDIFQAERLKETISTCDVVIDLVGILFEKKFQNLTYQKMIVESAQIISNAAQQTNVSVVIFVSAAIGIPLIGKKYLLAKREAEHLFKGKSFEGKIIRPPLLYGKAKKSSIYLAYLLKVGMYLPFLKNVLRPYQAEAVEEVAKKIVALC